MIGFKVHKLFLPLTFSHSTNICVLPHRWHWQDYSLLFHDSSLLPTPWQVFTLDHMTTGIVREKVHMVGYPRGWEHIFEIFLKRKNSWPFPGFEPPPPACQASALSITPSPSSKVHKLISELSLLQYTNKLHLQWDTLSTIFIKTEAQVDFN